MFGLEGWAIPALFGKERLGCTVSVSLGLDGCAQ